MVIGAAQIYTAAHPHTFTIFIKYFLVVRFENLATALRGCLGGALVLFSPKKFIITLNLKNAFFSQKIFTRLTLVEGKKEME